MAVFEVEFYQLPNGREPAREFLMGLEMKMRAKMADTISLLQDNGFELREPYSKHLTEGFSNLRQKWALTQLGFCISSTWTGASY